MRIDRKIIGMFAKINENKLYNAMVAILSKEKRNTTKKKHIMIFLSLNLT